MEIQRLYLSILEQTHVIIAGCTGSGKSVVLNNIIHAHFASSGAAAVLLDPKRVELLPWARDRRVIAHATNGAEIEKELSRLCGIMEKRFREMERRGQRKTDQVHIYVYVDELADLVSGTPKTLDYLIRLLRLGRAAGIHVIAATQDPSRKTLSAQLMQNFSAALGLRCRSAIESRQIIGATGCELLPRYGSALYYCPELLQPVPVKIDLLRDAELFATICA